MAKNFDNVEQSLAKDAWSGEGILWPRRHGQQSYVEAKYLQYVKVPDSETCDDGLKADAERIVEELKPEFDRVINELRIELQACIVCIFVGS